MNPINDKTYIGSPDRLRRPERVDLIQPDKVVRACLNGYELRSVLDVGTGTGLFAERFAALGLEVTGVDRNPDYLEQARHLVPSARFLQKDMDELSFEPGSFDLVFMGLAFHETDRPEKVLADCRRIAGKAVCILEWPYLEEDQGPPLHHRLKPERVTALAENTGFPDIRTSRIGHMILYTLNK